jgi:hypothetical protein
MEINYTNPISTPHRASWWAAFLAASSAACCSLLFDSTAKVLGPVTYPPFLLLSLPSARTVHHAVRAFCLSTSEVIA